MITEIVYFHRSRKSGYSIVCGFRPLIEQFGKSANVSVKEFYVPCYRASPLKMIRNILYVYRNRSKTGINHITGDIHYCIIGLTGCKSVLTIHDDSPVAAARNRIDRLLKRFLWFYLPVKLAGKVVCISDHTKKRVDDLVKNNKTSVLVNQSVDTGFNCVEKVFNKECPVILQIGTLKHKNLETTIRAIQGIKCKLRVISEMTGEQHQLAGDLGIDYSNAYDLSDKEMVNEYISADIVAFPSLYEGFGMPILEGQATGRTVITSAASPMKEVAGGGCALLKNPLDVMEYRNLILRIIHEDLFREDLIRKGLENVKKYTVAHAYEQYDRLYREM